MYAWVLLLCSIVPQPAGVERESVDAIEVSAFYDENGRLVFDQALFKHSGQIQAWRLIKTQGQIPERDWENGGYVTMWHDGETLRQVRTKSVQESWLQYDVELIGRETFPKEMRKELRVVKVKRTPVLTR
jgi:hypothetical protein